MSGMEATSASASASASVAGAGVSGDRTSGGHDKEDEDDPLDVEVEAFAFNGPEKRYTRWKAALTRAKALVEKHSANRESNWYRTDIRLLIQPSCTSWIRDWRCAWLALTHRHRACQVPDRHLRGREGSAACGGRDGNHAGCCRGQGLIA